MRAITFDFYNTLVYHRAGTGRGRQYQDYLAAAGLTADPWEHQVLYDVFEYYAAAYSPALSEEAKLSFWIEFSRRLFERTNVRLREAIDYAQHAPAIRDIMGPNAFAVFTEALPALRTFKKKGLRLGVISDWQKGLQHFCEELGLAAYLDVVVASAEVGCQKPDPRLFEIARERLKIPAPEILHVGDTLADVEGARAAGFSVLLLVREGDPPTTDVPLIRHLRELLPLPPILGALKRGSEATERETTINTDEHG
ncbi:MAG: HAD-IA family hydrolase [Acidobacteria bacterium]|nr:HAD-IA family hydrolase [Acidobacteriota bacterium]